MLFWYLVNRYIEFCERFNSDQVLGLIYTRVVLSGGHGLPLTRINFDGL